MKELEKYNTCLKRINKFSQNLGIKKGEQTILKMSQGKNDNEKCLTLENGNFEGPEPWFIIDENHDVKTIFSVKTLLEFFQNTKKIQRDNFELKLEKAIYQKVPIDFNDVWVVAMDEIRRQMASGVKEMNINIEQVLNKIHSQHPNLFIDMKEMMLKAKNDERL